ncbi:MAG: HlyD family efflux transporter periplasmic adaptor subunit [Clostridia bacterium]
MEQQINENNEYKVKKERNIKKILLYIVIFLVLIYVIYTIYLLIKQPTDIFTLEDGTLYSEETDIGYVIRDENVIQGENYKNGMEKIKAEGEKVAVNEAIYRYYTKNEDSLKQKISDLDNKIQEAMSNQSDLLTSDIKSLETQIESKMIGLNKETDTSKLSEYKKEISEAITKKSNIAGDLSPQGSYLKQLIQERKKYENELNSGAEYVKAAKSGIVSYKVDGLEETLKPTEECFSALSKDYLDKLELKTGKIIPTSDECGKIVDNTYCYIATITNSDQAKNAKVGDKVEVRLSSNNEVPAEITYTWQEDSGDMVIVLKIEKGVEELVNYRKISFDLIWWSENGLRVPNQAIVKKDDLAYVIRNRAGYLSKILVKVKKEGEKYSIVRAYTTEELKTRIF